MFFNLFMSETLVGQPGLAGHRGAAEAHLGTAVRDAKLSLNFGEALEPHWGYCTLMLLHWGPGGVPRAAIPQCHPCQAGHGSLPGVTFCSPALTSDPSQLHLPPPISLPLLHPHFSLKLILPAPLERCSHQQGQRLGQKSPAGRNWSLFWKQIRLKFRWSCKHSWKHLLLEAKAPKPSNSTQNVSWGGNHLEIDNKLPDQLVLIRISAVYMSVLQGSHAVSNTSLSRTLKQAEHGTHTAITNKCCVPVVPKGLKNSSHNI